LTIINFPVEPPSSIRSVRCRLCLSSALELLFSLKPTPPAEWYFPENYRSSASRLYPLDLYMCLKCFHIQLVDIIDPKALFTNYFYQSQSSPGLNNHFKNYASHVASKIGLKQESLVVDVGSNDGTLLDYFKNLGYRVAGIEPSVNLAAQCNARGIQTYNSFLNHDVVKTINSDLGHVELVTANNVFAHNDDLRSMAMCVRDLLKPGGIFAFEVSSIMHTMKGSVFDYIYHEHLSYHSMISLIPFLKEFDLNVYDVEFVETKGGSYRVYAQKGELKSHPTVTLKKAIQSEYENGLQNSHFYKNEMARVRRQKDKVREFFNSEQRFSKVVGFGASATTTTLVYEFELIDKISYLVDDNPIRHGCFLPGTEIKVYPPSSMTEDNPEVIILLAWRFSELILPKLKSLNLNPKYILRPLPEFQVNYLS
jgi:SAM-dependent methyltransferase